MSLFERKWFPLNCPCFIFIFIFFVLFFFFFFVSSVLVIIHLLISRTLYNWCRWLCECLFYVTWWAVIVGRGHYFARSFIFHVRKNKQMKTNRIFDVFVGFKTKISRNEIDELNIWRFFETCLRRSKNAHFHFSIRLGWHTLSAI